MRKCYCTFYKSANNHPCVLFDEAASCRWPEILRKGSFNWTSTTDFRQHGGNKIIHVYSEQIGRLDDGNIILSAHLSELGFTWRVVGEDPQNDNDIQIELIRLKKQ